MPRFVRGNGAGARLVFGLRGEQLEARLALSNVPVLFVPGQPASLPRDVIHELNAGKFAQAGVHLQHFLTHLGTSPENLTTEFTVKPLGVTSPSNALLQALRDVGYQDGVDLFAAVHDWRMPVAPADGVDDGFLANVTTEMMTNGQFNYGVSYLGYWLEKAEAAWLADPTNLGPFPGVSIISHSEGNLLVRAYVSSAAYLDPTMPKVQTWVAAAPPFQGASGIHNLLLNNFANPLGGDVANGGLYPFVELPYVQVASFGGTIYGPAGGAAITRASITNPLTGKPDPYRFMEQYIPSLWAENATYAFLDGHTVNGNPRYRNALLLDVNWTASGGVATGFVSQLDAFAVIYGTKNTTLTYAKTQPATFIKPVLPLIASAEDVLGMFTFKPWVKDVSVASNGDGFIPIASAVPPSFVGQPGIRLLPQSYNIHGQPVDHDDTISDPKSIKAILGELGFATWMPNGVKVPVPVAEAGTPPKSAGASANFARAFLSTFKPVVNKPTGTLLAKLFAAFAAPMQAASLSPAAIKPRRM